MIRFFQIAVFISAVLVPTGCKLPQRSKPVWEQAKIGDLAPAGGAKKLDEQLLKTANFKVYVFEMPAENISALNDVWQMLRSSSTAESRQMGPVYSKRLQFDNHNAFSANYFAADCGQIQVQNIIDLMHTAGGKTVETVSLLLSDGQAQTIDITRLNSEQTVFYASAEGSMEGATVGPGLIALQIKADKIPGSKYVCDVGAQPVFLPPMVSPIQELADHAKTKEFFFTCCRFRLRMSPGDFILLGPQKYTDQRTTLGGLFFSRPDRNPVVRTLLLLCTSIND